MHLGLPSESSYGAGEDKTFDSHPQGIRDFAGLAILLIGAVKEGDEIIDPPDDRQDIV
jgi:hypothetical protein